LAGNPSDGYHGKVLSVIVRDFFAEVVLYEWEDVEIVWSQEDQSRFDSVRDLVRDVKLHGYYGGIRLVKATVKTFVDYCDRQGHPLHDRNFSVRYESSIPRQVGLAGSSAIIVATLRALTDFYGVEIPREVLPSIALSVETRELGIAGGFQDRVIQVYEGLVYMDLAADRMRDQFGYSRGAYEPLDPALLPPLYLAYSTLDSEPTEIFHNNLRGRFDRGDPEVVAAMHRFAELAVEAKRALLARDPDGFARAMNENFDTRRSICRLCPGHVEMVERARQVGASAKFAGSGGAIVGVYRDEAMFERLKHELAQIRCQVVKPVIAELPTGRGH
jgi:glucuronokinase